MARCVHGVTASVLTWGEPVSAICWIYQSIINCKIHLSLPPHPPYHLYTYSPEIPVDQRTPPRLVRVGGGVKVGLLLYVDKGTTILGIN